MRRNMNVYGGVVFSQRVLLALVGTGMSREGLPVVQRNALTAWNTEGGTNRANLEADADVTSRLNADQRVLARSCPGQPGRDLGAAGDLSLSWPNRWANEDPENRCRIHNRRQRRKRIGEPIGDRCQGGAVHHHHIAVAQRWIRGTAQRGLGVKRQLRHRRLPLTVHADQFHGEFVLPRRVALKWDGQGQRRV